MNKNSSLYGSYKYDPLNPAFWLSEFRDANNAGLQFLAPNVYGRFMSGHANYI